MPITQRSPFDTRQRYVNLGGGEGDEEGDEDPSATAAGYPPLPGFIRKLLQAAVAEDQYGPGRPAKYGYVRDPRVPAARAPSAGRAAPSPSLGEQQQAHADYYEEQSAASQARRALEGREFEYKQEQDRLTREHQAALDEAAKAIDGRDFEAGQHWKQVADDRAQQLTNLNEAYRRDELKLRAEIDYASSRRADITTNLARQNQAFTQEEIRRRELRETAMNPRDIYGYAFEKAGMAAPAGTSLAELQAQIRRTPDVEDYLNGQGQGTQAISPAQTQATGGPPMAYDVASIQAELEANRRKAQQATV